MEHLNDIHTYYFLDPDDRQKVKPISEIDCKIVENLVTLVERMGIAPLADILKRYKLDSDRFILEELDELISSDFIEEYLSSKSSGASQIKSLLESIRENMIKVGTMYVRARNILSINVVDTHNGEREMYSIIINDERGMPDSYRAYPLNLVVDFYTKEERDSEIDSLKRLMAKNMFKFVN